MKTKILVAMSGGVDSAVAPLLLRDAGYTVGGAIMELRPGMDAEIRRAETIAGLLGIPFYVFPMQKEFDELVIQPFARTYLQGGKRRTRAFSAIKS